MQIQSRHSESNLMRIDKEKTFMQQQNSIDNTGDLLARVVFALNSLHQTIEKVPVPNTSFDGKQIFTDENIREGEEWSIITAATNNSKMWSHKKSRSRARSLYPQISKISSDANPQQQFTWAGNNNDIQNYINAQVKNEKKSQPSPPSKKDHCNVFINGDKSKDFSDTASTTMRRKSIFSVFNGVFRRRNTASAMHLEPQVEQIDPARLSLAKNQSSPAFERKNSTIKEDDFPTDCIRRSSLLSNQSSISSEQLLENTTIADLIRAIENIHVTNLISPKSINSRRISLAAQSSIRRDSSTVSTSLDTPSPTSIKSNRFNSQRSPNRIMPVRQNSTPNRFLVTPVTDTGTQPSSAISLSPVVQRRLRQFSTVSAATLQPQHKFGSSLQTSPLVTRRTQFKPAISPLAMKPPTQLTQ